ncbi:MAG: hypothetical protein KatS3mg101_0861 [Patescibacteria group bacterium]|nr:MAG: hypothetical protein KatS3mg101_0861 [Patescibacteria group bacterium]
MEKFIPVYPLVEDVNFQLKIKAKREFNELASKLDEKMPTPGSLFLNQKLFSRFMTVYDRILNISETGVGKTCQIVALRESLKKEIKKCYIMVRRSNVNQFKKQIVFNCAPGVYKVSDGKPTSSLNKWYRVMTYTQFASMVKKLKLDDEGLNRYFSNSMFVIDEAHNLRNEGIVRKNRKVYETIKKVFHTVRLCKIIVSTATPMVNGIKDFIRIVNLVLPPDKQMPENWDYGKITLAQLEQFLRGRVFYIRSLNRDVEIENVGSRIYDKNDELYRYTVKVPAEDQEKVPLPFPVSESLEHKQPEVKLEEKSFTSQAVVYSTLMGDIQTAAYSKAASSNFHIQTRQASIFVFPDGTFGTEGFKRWVRKVNKKYQLAEELVEFIKDTDCLRRLSCKFAEIVEIELTEPGVGYAYIDFVRGSGAILLGLILQLFGFEEFNETESIFSTEHQVRRDFIKKRRYALISDVTPPRVRESILEVSQSPVNIDGEYVKFFIVSPMGKEGLNIFHARRGHLVTPGWHNPGMHQALSRIIRAVSHADLAKREKKKIKLKIYKHVAIPDDGTTSIDLMFYQHAEKKSILIHRMMRLLKQIDATCEINRERNIPPSDKDFTEECDYLPCCYECAVRYTGTEQSLEDDSSSYYLLFSEKDVNVCIMDILSRLKREPFVNADKLNYPEYIKKTAVEKLTVNGFVLRDRFGYNCTVKSEGPLIYLQKEHPSLTNTGSGLGYSNTLSVTETYSLYSLLNRITYDESTIKKIKSLTLEEIGQLYDLLESLYVGLRIELAEEAYKLYIEGSKEPWVHGCLQRYNIYFLTFKTSKKRYFVHSLNILMNELSTTKYASTSVFMKVKTDIRVYANGRFRDTLPEESEKLREKMVLRINLLSKFARRFTPFYGSIIYDKIFRIHVWDEDDTRWVNKGRECLSSWKESELVKILKSIFSVFLVYENREKLNEKKVSLLFDRIESYDNIKLLSKMEKYDFFKGIRKRLQYSSTNAEICNIIKKTMYRYGMLITEHVAITGKNYEITELIEKGDDYKLVSVPIDQLKEADDVSETSEASEASDVSEASDGVKPAKRGSVSETSEVSLASDVSEASEASEASDASDFSSTITYD